VALRRLPAPVDDLDDLVGPDNLLLAEGTRLLALGLLNRVVPKEKVLEEAKAMAKKLAAGAPVAQREIMKAVRLGLESNLRDGVMKIESAASKALMFTEDFKEGSKAFLEKRPPNFKGR